MSIRRLSCSVLLFLASTVLLSSGKSQTTVDLTQHLGIDPYGTYSGSQVDHIGMNSGNLSAQIPLFTLPQKGKLSLGFRLVINNNGWAPQSTCDDYGCTLGWQRSSAIGPELVLDNDPYVSSYALQWELSLLPQPACDPNATTIYECTPAGSPNIDCPNSGLGTLCVPNGLIEYNVNDSDGSAHALIEDANNLATLHTYDGSEYLYTPSFDRPFDLWSGTDPNTLSIPNPMTEAYLNRGFLTTPPEGLGDTGGRAPGSITDSSGISYYYAPIPVSPSSPDPTYGSGNGIEVISDKDGNKITISPYWGYGSATILDSVNRTISSPSEPISTTTGCPSITDPGKSSPTPADAKSTWTVPGPNGQVTYLICYETVQINTNFDFSYIISILPTPICAPGTTGTPDAPCDAEFQPSGSSEAIQSVVLPNGTFWGFSYNPLPANNSGDAGQYGDISQIILPSGASIQYTYLGKNAALYNGNRFISKRTVVPVPGTGESSATWTYSWSPALIEGGAPNGSILGPDGSNTSYSYSYGSGASAFSPASQTVTTTGPSGESESTTTTYNVVGIPNIQVQADVNGNDLTGIQWPFYWLQASPWAGEYLIISSLPTKVVTTVSSNGGSYTASSTYTYDSAGMPAPEIQCNPALNNPLVYVGPDLCANIGNTTTAATGAPFALGSRTGTVVTGTMGQFLQASTTSYAWQQPGSSYFSQNLMDRPYQTTSYTGSPDSNGSYASVPIAAQTTYTYDESAYDSGGVGNPTTVTQLNTVGSSVVTHSYYNSSGMVYQTQDPNGYFNYVSGFDCSGLFPQTTIQAYGTPIALTSKTTHDCNTGLVTQSQNANDLAASRPGTQTSYDSAGNPTLITYPDRGSTSFNYWSYATPFHITKSVADVTASGTAFSISTDSFDDGFGRTIETKDSSGAEVDTTYDLMGRVISVSNPYYTKTDSTYGNTTFSYDGLNRKTLQVDSDGANQQTWTYNGPTMIYTDENLHPWHRTYDELGRLTQVAEPGSLTTHYGYDVLGNLLTVNQTGLSGDTPRNRSFTYDSLSRLITSANPETGTICYGQWNGTSCQGGYDPNGNLLYKTDARGVVESFLYDALNRVTSKSFSNDPSSTPWTCYQYDSSTLATQPANLIGRLTNEWTQSPASGACAASLPASGVLTRKSVLVYDPMGRVKHSQQCVLTNCSSGTPFKLAQDYDLAGNMTRYTDGLDQMMLIQGFDSAGRLSTVTSSWNDPLHPPNLFSVQGYTPASGLQNWTLGNGLNLNRTYDQRLRVTSETATQP